MRSQRCRRSLVSELTEAATTDVPVSPRSSKRKKSGQTEEGRNKKMAKLDDPEVDSVKTKSFYGRGKGKYLNPLERKSISADVASVAAQQQTPETKPLAEKAFNVDPYKLRMSGGKKARKKVPLDVKKKTVKPVAEVVKPAPAAASSVKENRAKSPEKSPDKSRRFFKTRTSPRKRSLSLGMGKAAVSVHKSKGFNLKFQPAKKQNSRASLAQSLIVKSSSSPAPVRCKPPVLETRSPRLPRGVSRKRLAQAAAAANSDQDTSSCFDDEKSMLAAFQMPDSPAKRTEPGGEREGSPARSDSVPPSAPASPSTSSTTDSVYLLPEVGLQTEHQSQVSTANTITSSINEIPPSPGNLQSDQKKYFSIFQRSPKSTPSANDKIKKLNETPQSTSTIGSPSRKSKRHLVAKDTGGQEQMILDCGQKLIGAVQCKTCGMTYTHAEPTDEATHSKFHQNIVNVLKFPGWKKERVLQEYHDGSRIIVIMPDDKAAMKKVNAVKKIVDEDLGFVVEGSALRQQSKVFFYISSEKRIAGVCIAECIKQGYRVVSEHETQDSQSSTAKVVTRPLSCSTTPEPARCGINRIWVPSSNRRTGVASKIVDVVRKQFLMGYLLDKSEIAFSDPTPDGRIFAATYTGDPSFLVYKHHLL